MFPPSPQNLHCQQYHILTGDFNSWVGTEEEQHLVNHPGYPHIPNRVGDPIRDDNPKTESLTRRQSPHTLGPGVDYY